MRRVSLTGPDRRALLGGIAASATWTSAFAAPAMLRDVDRKLAATYAPDGPGAIAIAARDGALLYTCAFGMADVELAAALQPDDVVRIASLTKQFTAVAVLKLVEGGRLGLDDAAGSRLPDCPLGWRPITLRQLLNQTSGLTDDMEAIFSQPLVDRSPTELLAAYRDRPLVAPPGVQWRYSNLNYWILGQVIEATTGEPYADHIARHVLAPGMTRTRYGDALAIIPGRALGYEAAPDGGWRNARLFSQTIGYAAGGFLSTPLEMARWYAALGRGEIVSTDLLRQAGTGASTSGGRPTGYGLGWNVTQVAGQTALHHGGSSIGFEAYLYWIPSRALFAGVFKNRNDPRGEPQLEARMLLEALSQTTRA